MCKTILFRKLEGIKGLPNTVQRNNQLGDPEYYNEQISGGSVVKAFPALLQKRLIIIDFFRQNHLTTLIWRF